jgi:hypothetical protein
MLGDILIQIFVDALAVVIGRRLLRWRLFLLALFATIVVVVVFTFLFYSVHTADETLFGLWMMSLAFSPLILLVLMGVFFALNTANRSAEVQLMHFLGVCAVPAFVLVLVFAASYLSHSY